MPQQAFGYCGYVIVCWSVLQISKVDEMKALGHERAKIKVKVFASLIDVSE